MNWNAIGAIGELVGALAVVLTLGYLAVQVRHSILAMRVAAKQEMTRQFSDYTDLLLQNPELHALNQRGLAGEALDEFDAARFSILLQKATWYFASMHFQSEHQALNDDEWHQSRTLIAGYCRFPGYKTWWERNRHNYSSSFVGFIESHWQRRDAPEAAGANAVPGQQI